MPTDIHEMLRALRGTITAQEDRLEYHAERQRSFDETQANREALHQRVGAVQQRTNEVIPRHPVSSPEIKSELSEHPLHKTATNLILSQELRPVKVGHPTCNLFTDRILYDGAGVKLPRHKDSEYPMLQRELESHFMEQSKLDNSGVQKVTAEQGAKLAKEGQPVVAIGVGHVGVMAPADWPSMYSEHALGDRHYRGIDKPFDRYKYYAIQADQYNQVNQIQDLIDTK